MFSIYTAVAWNHGHRNSEELRNEVTQLLKIQADSDLYADILRRCSNALALAEGKRIHAHTVRLGLDSNTYLANHIVQMYGKCGKIEEAMAAFERISKPNVYSWNIIIACFAENGHLSQARAIFDQIPQRNVVSWNSMLGYLAVGASVKDGLWCYRMMLLEGFWPNKVTFLAIFEACAKGAALVDGKMIHLHAVEGGFENNVGSSIMNMYSKCGSVGNAKAMFDKIPDKDIVVWTAMVMGYTQNGQSALAIETFRKMDLEGVQPDRVMFINVMEACSLTEGELVHAAIIDSGLEQNVSVANAMTKMYSRCDRLDEAKKIFDNMQRDKISWNVIITAYAHKGHHREALELLEAMCIEGVLPNAVTFVSILSVCSHSGLFKDAHGFFLLMQNDFDVLPTLELYECMVDILGRAGEMRQAEELIKVMPMEPSRMAWRALLGACRINNNPKLASQCAEKVAELDPKDNQHYVLLANIWKER